MICKNLLCKQKEKNKENSIYRKYFPWASSTIEGLEIGDVVYIGFINNNIANILIIGKDLAATGSVGSGGGNLEIYTIDVLALTMPIIIDERQEIIFFPTTTLLLSVFAHPKAGCL